MATVVRALSGLADRLTGTLVLPDDLEYQASCKWLIGRWDDLLPLAVVRCADESDVIEALAFATAGGLPFAVRAGGHSFADQSSTDGLLIDLGNMRTIDIREDTVAVGPGVRIGELAAELARYGRVVPAGWCPTVSVTGAALGGGFGPLGRLYGLATDHVSSARVVLADGHVVQADERNEAELLWALRGAGAGNFGVVTELVLSTPPAVPIVDFACWWPVSAAPAVIGHWQEWAPDAPAEINVELALHYPPDPTVEATLTLFGVVAHGNPRQVRTLLREVAAGVGSDPERTHVSAVSAADAPTHHTYAGEPANTIVPGGRPPAQTPGLRLVRSDFVEGLLPPEVITELVDAISENRRASELRELEFVPWGAALGVPGDTAFPHRDARFLLAHSVQSFGSRTHRRAAHSWVARSRAVVQPWGNGHVYPNYPDLDLSDSGHAYYGRHHERLRRAKRRYDPTNAFRHAQSIAPATP